MADVDWAAAANEQERLLNQVSNLNVQDEPEIIKLSPKKEEAVIIREAVKPQDTDDEVDKEATSAEHSVLQKIIRTRLVTSKHDVEVQRQDPASPLYSVKSFNALNLSPELLKGVFAMGFNAPSKIQETALPTLLADPPQNMIAQSQSGTGKTAAFVLAMLSRIDQNLNCPQVLCLAPTYELALQTGEVAKKMAKYSKISIRYAVRGETIEKGSKILEHVVIGTPGKVLDFVVKYKFLDTSKLKVFVLDEADVMIAQQGHQFQSIRIHKQLPKTCQMMLFSATYEEEVMHFAEALIPNPVVIRLKREEESLDNIKQYYVWCTTQEQKYTAISNIYGVSTIGQAMIFCHTRKTANWLAGKLVADGHTVALLTGELDISQRISILDRFRQVKERVLITTNVLARGIDVETVNLVINFDMPVDQHGRADCETYLHRIGRTGRFGKTGLAINLVDGNKAMSILRDIQDHFGKNIVKLDAEDVDEIDKLQD